jgi:hypothetical protein
MKYLLFSTAVVAIFTFGSLSGVSNAADQGTKDEAVAMVKKPSHISKQKAATRHL